MQKKMIICLGILSVLMLLFLTSCGMSSDALEIENISAEVQSDGSTRITIKYFDDIEDPVVFDIPAGLQGEQGKDGEQGLAGNGIARIDVENSGIGVQTLTVVYTDATVEPSVFTVKDGVQILSAERVDDEETGIPYLVIKYSDGNESKVELPKGAEGAQGVGIQSVSYASNPLTKKTDVTFHLTNGEEYIVAINAGEKGETGVGIAEITTPEPWEEDGVVKGIKFDIVLTDEVTTTIKLYNGVDVSNITTKELKDDKGNVIGTQLAFVKSDASVTDFIDILNGVGIKNIDPELQADGTTLIRVVLSDGSEESFSIPAAVSLKEVIPETDGNGNTKLTFVFTDDSIEPVEVTLQAARGIKDIHIAGMDDEYIDLLVTYTNNDTTTIQMPRNTAWLKGFDQEPAVSDGKEGDYYYDWYQSKIWYKSENGWEEVIDFYAFDKNVSVTFEIDFQSGEKWETTSITSKTRSFTLNVGESFAVSDQTIPVPIKTPTQAELEAGITGYRFAGWYTTRNPNATNGVFTDVTVVSGEMTLVPYWEAIYGSAN